MKSLHDPVGIQGADWKRSIVARDSFGFPWYLDVGKDRRSPCVVWNCNYASIKRTFVVYPQIRYNEVFDITKRLSQYLSTSLNRENPGNEVAFKTLDSLIPTNA